MSSRAQGGKETQGSSSAERLEGGLHADILITDHLMHGMTGGEFAHWLAGQPWKMPVLIVSGFTDAENIPAGIPRLGKPFLQADLAASLLKMTERGVRGQQSAGVPNSN